ncbi:cysteine desulfurase family protein [Cumulibacter manganitolerans]|uniref:cysteine desulfurase family protein n=1 Tax=Cumulibacter manganitolerans TaxID=1884992 RepID=UPI001295E181|nr:cysteine desulfurase family protein [Cumulibacter manganitolerans]
MSEVYLDHAATTVVRARVIDEMTRVLRETGNASSLHAAGRRARREIEQAREQVAEAIGAHPIEVVFTSGATEADNLAVVGGYRWRRATDPARSTLAVTPVEHPAVLDAAQALVEDAGATLRWIEVDEHGAARVDDLAEIVTDPSLAIASAMWANNEVGTLSDIPAMARICADAGVPFHVDAVQAVGRVPIDFAALRITSLALSAHKLGGPQGIGALVAGRAFTPRPTSHGGGQERRLRSGTLNVAGAVGLAVALTAAEEERVAEAARLGALRDRLTASALRIEGLQVNGHASASEPTLPGTLNLHIPGADADAVLMLLDAEQIAVSTGAACSAGVSEPSRVLLAMLGDDRRARQSIRISMGRTTTDADVDRLLAVLPRVVEQARRATGYRDPRG